MPEQIEVIYVTAQNPAENRTKHVASLDELEVVLGQLVRDGARVQAVLVLPRCPDWRVSAAD